MSREIYDEKMTKEEANKSLLVMNEAALSYLFSKKKLAE